MVKDTGKNSLVSEKRVKIMQSIVGSYLYYPRELYCTMFSILNEILWFQVKLTEHAKEECQKLQDLDATSPKVRTQYCGSDVILQVTITVAYVGLSKTKLWDV